MEKRNQWKLKWSKWRISALYVILAIGQVLLLPQLAQANDRSLPCLDLSKIDRAVRAARATRYDVIDLSGVANSALSTQAKSEDLNDIRDQENITPSDKEVTGQTGCRGGYLITTYYRKDGSVASVDRDLITQASSTQLTIQASDAPYSMIVKLLGPHTVQMKLTLDVQPTCDGSKAHETTTYILSWSQNSSSLPKQTGTIQQQLHFLQEQTAILTDLTVNGIKDCNGNVQNSSYEKRSSDGTSSGNAPAPSDGTSSGNHTGTSVIGAE